MIKQIILTACSLIVAGCAGERPKNLGARDGLLSACPGTPNCVSSQAKDEKHRIAPLLFTGEADAAFYRLKQLLILRKDTTVTDASASYLRVEFRTRTGFVDDGEFLLDRAGSQIHVRSAARLGYSDLGKNRSRLEDIRQQFREPGK